MRYALIAGGRVAAVVEQASMPTVAGLWVVCLNAGPGWAFDGAVFTAPVTDPSPRHITRLALRSRFTSAEKVALEIASLDIPSATMPQRQQAAALRVYLADVGSALWIDLDRADTRAGVQSLEALGLLAAGRAAQILDGAIADSERPT